MRHLRKTIALLLSLVLLVLLGACTGSQNGASENGGGENSKYGGKLVVSNINEPHCLDPRKDVGTYGGIVCNQVFEHLIGTDPVTGGPVPGLATEWYHTEDGLIYTFKLREGVKWQNGADFTADDVVYTFDYLLGKTENYTEELVGMFSLIDSCEKIDDYTVQFNFKQPWDSFEAIIQNNTATFIVCKEHCEQYAWDDYGLDENVVGTGPFKVQTYLMGEPVVLVRNGSYWNPELPYLDEIEFRYISDATVRALNAVTNEVDVTNEPATDTVETMLAYDNLTLQNVSGNGVISIQINTDVDNSPFGDLNARLAVAYALDREAMCKAIYGDNAIVAYDDFPAWHESYDPNYRNYEYNPELAKEYLAKAGYNEENPMKFTHLTTTNSVLVDMLTIAQEQLAQVGIEMEILPLESGVRNAIIKGKNGYSRDDFKCITTLQAMPSGTTDDYIYKYFMPDGESNQSKLHLNLDGGYQDESFIPLVNEARQTLDVEKRTALYREAIEIIDSDCPRIPLVYVNNMAIVNTRVHDFYLLNTPVVSYAQVYVD